VYGPERVNDLPVMVLARDRVTLPVRARDGVVHGVASAAADAVPAWQRWYDYGIGLFREADRGAGRGALRQADEAFVELSKLAPSLGALARARLAIREGRLDDASAMLAIAAQGEKGDAGAPAAPPWSLAYFTALVDKQNGNFARAAEAFDRVRTTDFAGARERGFNFALDTRVLNELSETLLEQALVEQGESRTALVNRALSVARAALEVDPEHAQAWWLVNRAATELGDEATAANAREKHARYKPDENARDRAVRLAREKYPWANAAAEATVLYPMHREGRMVGDLLPGTRVEVGK